MDNGMKNNTAERARRAGGEMRVKNPTTHFLKNSLIGIIILCALFFALMAVIMNYQSAQAIGRVGAQYMSGMSEQISLHFQTAVSFRLSQLKAITHTIPLDSVHGYDQMREELVYNARARDFEALALYMPDGSFEMLYGSPVSLVDPQPFYDSIAAGEDKVAVGLNEEGGKVVLLGICADYAARGGAQSLALVGVLPEEYITATLALNEDTDAQMYAHIIRRDGSYIVRTQDGGDNYFDAVRSMASGRDARLAEEYIQEMQTAMDSGENYSGVFSAAKARRHVYCSALPYSEWYLVIVTPYGTLDEAVDRLSNQSILLAVACFAILLAGLMLVFAKYYRMTGRQIDEQQKARVSAVRASNAKSEFLSNISHDIRTPMNAIVGMTAIAMANIDNQEQVKNCLEKITLSSKHLLGLINDILDMSKIESGKMTLNIDHVSLREVVDGVVNIVHPQVRAKQQHFDVLIQDISVENVCCDSVRLNQMLINLLSNAVKFTPEGGHIEMALREASSPRGDGFIRMHLRVKDDGIGMAPEFKKILFQAFAREDIARVHNIEGTGLGMTITKYIVDMMKGTIEVDSEQGKGSEFRVTLDLQKAPAAEEKMVLPGWRTLVVDDDETLCETTIASLREIGIPADWTPDAETAIRKIEERRGKSDAYQIILLDGKLSGMDGVAAAREIRAHVGRDAPVLLISAYDWTEIEEEARGAGVTGFISKPLFKSTLYDGLKKYAGEERRAVEESKADKVRFAGRRVLVAEDNELNWEITNELLSEMEMQLDWAENGKLCVEMFEKSPIGYYDAILMDLRMPVMMGYEATERIRKLPRADANLPIIAMTADAFSEDVKRCLASGMDAHISKPIDLQEVERTLEKYMKPRAQRAAQ